MSWAREHSSAQHRQFGPAAQEFLRPRKLRFIQCCSGNFAPTVAGCNTGLRLNCRDTIEQLGDFVDGDLRLIPRMRLRSIPGCASIAAITCGPTESRSWLRNPRGSRRITRTPTPSWHRSLAFDWRRTQAIRATGGQIRLANELLLRLLQTAPPCVPDVAQGIMKVVDPLRSFRNSRNGT